MRRPLFALIALGLAAGCLCGPAGGALPEGEASDAGSFDALGGPDAAGDAPDGSAAGDAASDGGSPSPDAAAAVDSGAADAGAGADASAGSDASAAADAGAPGTVWLEIDYSNAYTPSSPAWSYSPTPGWGEAQWATQGKSWPEAWDRFNNMSVVDDRIGRELEIGSSSQLQLMIGLEQMLGYSSARVRLEGRSLATSSTVSFDVYNPLNNCGASGTMSQDWTVHVVELDLGHCLLTGSGAGVEAIRVAPTNGTLALVRMRVTLLGASW